MECLPGDSVDDGNPCTNDVCVGGAITHDPAPMGSDCGGGHVCDGTTCVCPQGTESCGGVCVDLIVNQQHCGKCGASCGVDACSKGGCEVVVSESASWLDMAVVSGSLFWTAENAPKASIRRRMSSGAVDTVVADAHAPVGLWAHYGDKIHWGGAPSGASPITSSVWYHTLSTSAEGADVNFEGGPSASYGGAAISGPDATVPDSVLWAAKTGSVWYLYKQDKGLGNQPSRTRSGISALQDVLVVKDRAFVVEPGVAIYAIDVAFSAPELSVLSVLPDVRGVGADEQYVYAVGGQQVWRIPVIGGDATPVLDVHDGALDVAVGASDLFVSYPSEKKIRRFFK